ncbi:MAG TPA: hypothetical protein DDW94_05335 [Deltaproteobacteria bacterium]|nr:MAG: hypothetical protein A2Z79_04620 [Deltaproteobacteria bacterium GWA2_55_82]OGQ64204.1 MAG: hypothetical protein A3I81_11010 [Deltaproteobacteria bacterium RIFCSPLOWO2_02_FULL_55_12]OIJ74659.1 MAG: hypothetical protein A2V21_310530 [Deltaproteobacteria bacterium GWC2_55_46]HBG46397.1 hypothetical protein [Deltaproteobacteria bacterium]HCY10608.1 hypothetical protein [Deltaproteobacteria bacterium]
MTNYEVIAAITDNIESALKRQGLNFSRKTFESPESIPAGALPLGQIFYLGEEFGGSLGEKPKYCDAAFLIRIILAAREPSALIREQQRTTHSIRGALTVDFLNSGALSTIKSVSRVNIEKTDVVNRAGMSDLNMKAAVRYREP